MANRVSTVKVTQEQLDDIRDVFDKVDKDGNGYIVTEELGNALKDCELNIPGYQLRDLITKYDTSNDGRLSFDEFIECYRTLLTEKTGVAMSFKKMVVKKENIKTHGGSTAASSEGTTHSVSPEETSAFTDWINSVLKNDVDLQSHIPIEDDDDDLFVKSKDGILLCKLINTAVSDTIDERVINLEKLNKFKIMENLELAINSASSIGCNVVNVGSTDIFGQVKHIILGLMWQIIRIGLLSDINLTHHPGLVNLLLEDEELEDLQRLSPEQILIRWVNYHMERSGSDRRIKGFTDDIKDADVYGQLIETLYPTYTHEIDSEVYTNLLYQICPIDNDPPVNIIPSGMDPEKRAERVLGEAEKLDCRSFVTAKDIVKGNYRLNLAFVANLFNKHPALDTPEDMDRGDYEETREEKTYRNWMNSVGVSPFVHHLYSDLNNGVIILKLFDIVKPGIVDWKKVTTDFSKKSAGINKVENCNYAIELARQMDFSTVGIGGEDIFNETKTLVLALIWQLMRAYTVSVLTKIKEKEEAKSGDSKKGIVDADIVNWANDTLRAAGKDTSFKSFKDPALNDGVVLADLLDSMKPGCINNKYIDRDCGDDDTLRLSNAKYAITTARKLGARVYALPEDIVEMKTKMVMTIFACVMERALKMAE